MDDKLIQTIGLLITLWVASAFAHYYLGPKRKKRVRVDYMCGYHIASFNRKGQMAVLNSEKCFLCKEEG